VDAKPYNIPPGECIKARLLMGIRWLQTTRLVSVTLQTYIYLDVRQKIIKIAVEIMQL
jgi:hypothetical protein